MNKPEADDAGLDEILEKSIPLPFPAHNMGLLPDEENREDNYRRRSNEQVLEARAKIKTVIQAWYTARLQRLLDSWPEELPSPKIQHISLATDKAKGYNAALSETKAVLTAAIDNVKETK